MTYREVFEGVLFELNKVGSPDLLLDDFVYFINKGVSNYINKRYSVYDANQQTSDDLQVLKDLDPILSTRIRHIGTTQELASGRSLKQAKFDMRLKKNYFHMLNCILTYELAQNYRCYDKGYKIQMPAKRITQDAYSAILNNAWLKPQWREPYFMVHNNQNTINGNWATNNIYANDSVKDKIKRNAGDRIAHNAFHDNNNNGLFDAADEFSGPNLVIDYGTDSSLFLLHKVEVNYLKVPAAIRLTPEQIDVTEDLSPLMEFPDYVCREIIKETVTLLKLRNNDPSLEAHVVVNESIPRDPNGGQQRQ